MMVSNNMIGNNVPSVSPKAGLSGKVKSVFSAFLISLLVSCANDIPQKGNTTQPKITAEEQKGKESLVQGVQNNSIQGISNNKNDLEGDGDDDEFDIIINNIKPGEEKLVKISDTLTVKIINKPISFTHGVSLDGHIVVNLHWMNTQMEFFHFLATEGGISNITLSDYTKWLIREINIKIANPGISELKTIQQLLTLNLPEADMFLLEGIVKYRLFEFINPELYTKTYNNTSITEQLTINTFKKIGGELFGDNSSITQAPDPLGAFLKKIKGSPELMSQIKTSIANMN